MKKAKLKRLTICRKMILEPVPGAEALALALVRGGDDPAPPPEDPHGRHITVIL